MDTSDRKETFWTAAGFIALSAVYRLLPHPPNVTPLAAMALLGGAYLGPRQALLFPLAALFLSDLFLGLHATIPFVYASFLATALIGRRLRLRRSSGRVLGAALASSLLFFVVTNFGVWLSSGLYPSDAAGLAACYAAAAPFFRSSILGDVLFTGLLFGLEHASLKRLQARRPAPAAA